MASPPPRLSSNSHTYAPPTLHDTSNPRSHLPDSERYGGPNTYYPPLHAPSPPLTYTRYSRQSSPYILPPYLGAPPPHPPAPPLPRRPHPVFQSNIATGTSADGVEQRLQRSQTTLRHDSSSSPSGFYGGGDEDLDDGMGQIDSRLLAEEDDAAKSDCDSSPKHTGIGLPCSEKRHNEAYYPGVHHQVQFLELKKSREYQPSSMNLNSLGDGETGERPQYDIGTIIKCAILGSPRQRLTLNELYEAIEQRFSYYKTAPKKHSWKNTVRYTLSLKQRFVKEPRPITEPGKGNYWLLAPNEPQGNKRERKRNRKSGKRALAAIKEGAKQQEPPRDTAQPPLPPLYTQPVSAHGSPRTAEVAPLVDTTTTVGVRVVHHDKTIRASAGRYAAVTGALPHPAPIDVDSLQPECQPAGTIEQQGRPSPSSIRPQRTQTKRAQDWYNPLSVIRPLRFSNLRQPQDTFNALAAEVAAEIARDGIERSGGPALRALPTLVTSDDENESESEQSDDTDEYLPGRRRRMSRRGM